MPPLKSVSASEPQELLQGDLLKLTRGLTYSSVEDDFDIAPSYDMLFSHGLIVSRDCVALQKGEVVVAGVKPTNWKVPQIREGEDRSVSPDREFDDFCRALESFRDGASTPDRFYLGHLPESGDVRLVAHLESLVTVKLPDEGRLEEFIRRTRVARLDVEFRAALPTRIFSAFCRGVFDDHSWLSTPDLALVVAIGQKLEAEIKAEVELAKEDLGAQRATQARAPTKKLDTQLSKLEKLLKSLSPYQNELQKRQRP